MNKKILIIFFALIVFDGMIWFFALSKDETPQKALTFFDVGQGDSQLIQIPTERETIDILIDGGPGQDILNRLENALKPDDRYIDILVVTHPEKDHLGGIVEVLERYDVGIVITGGRRNDSALYDRFETYINERMIPRVALSQGDSVRHKDTMLTILSPDDSRLLDADLNEASLVMLFETPVGNEIARALYTGDIGFETEQELADIFDLDVDILKVAHHGSRFSSSKVFLEEATPLISIIGVGQNTYGHPSPDALRRLSESGTQTYTTQDDGSIRIVLDNDALRVYRIR